MLEQRLLQSLAYEEIIIHGPAAAGKTALLLGLIEAMQFSDPERQHLAEVFKDAPKVLFLSTNHNHDKIMSRINASGLKFLKDPNRFLVCDVDEFDLEKTCLQIEQVYEMFNFNIIVLDQDLNLNFYHNGFGSQSKSYSIFSHWFHNRFRKVRPLVKTLIQVFSTRHREEGKYLPAKTLNLSRGVLSDRKSLKICTKTLGNGQLKAHVEADSFVDHEYELKASFNFKYLIFNLYK